MTDPDSAEERARLPTARHARPWLARRLPWIVGVLGAIATASAILWTFGELPYDGVIWGGLLVIATCVGIYAAGVVLAWRNVTRRPRVLLPVTAVLLLLSMLPVECYLHDANETPVFLAHADSLQAYVMGRNIFGNLLIRWSDPPTGGRLIAERKRAHERFHQGDSIWIYHNRDWSRVMVWPPGPDPYYRMRPALWLWVIGGVLLTGYGPLLMRRLRGHSAE